MGEDVGLYFYNINYNKGSEDGTYSYCWGTLVATEDELKDIMKLLEHSFKNWSEMYNLNLTAFNKL